MAHLEETWNYIRMSTEEQEDSPATQGQHTETFIQQDNLPAWSRSYFDLAITGASLDKRPGIIALLADAERLRPACIVFYKLDRAFRNSFEQAAALRRLKRFGIRVLKVRDPNIDGPQGELIDSVLGAVNQFERELTGLRIRDHNLAMAQRGEWPGGPAPFGYRYRKPVKEQTNRKARVIEPGGLEPDPGEWPVARQLWEWALEGRRNAEILDLITQRGFRRRSGGAWNFVKLGQFYRNRIYAGMVPFGHHTHKNGGQKHTGAGEWFRGRHAPVVTAHEFARVQAMLRQGIPNQRQRRYSRAELAGLVRCSLCGGPVNSGNPTADGRYTYFCVNAAQRLVQHGFWSRREWILHMAVESVLEEAVGCLPEELPPTDSEQRRDGIREDIARLERRLKRLRELYVLGEYADDLAAYQQHKIGLETQIAARQAELSDVGPDVDELRDRHQALRGRHVSYRAAASVMERQQVWRLFVELVEMDGEGAAVWLLDLGPGVPRQFRVGFPPRGTKRLGTDLGQGRIVGQAKEDRNRAYLVKAGFPVSPVVRS